MKNRLIKLIMTLFLAFALIIPSASASVGDLIVTLGQQAIISSTPVISQVYSAVQLAEQASTLAAAVSGGPAAIAALGGQFALSAVKDKGMSAILGSQAAGQISQVENYGKILAQGSGFKDVKINKERGFIEEGTMTIKSEDGAEKEVSMKNLKFSFDENTKTGKYTFGESSSLEIGDRKYENIESGGIIQTDKEGSVISADITSTDISEYKFGDNNPIKVSANSHVTFKDGIIKIESLKDVEYLGKKINGNFHEINIVGNEVVGESFLMAGNEEYYPVIIDGKEISGKFSIQEKGFLLHENSRVYDDENKIEVSAESSKILYANSDAFTYNEAKNYENDIIWQDNNNVVIKSRNSPMLVNFIHEEGKKEIFIDSESSAWVSSVKEEFKVKKGKVIQIITNDMKTPEEIQKELEEDKNGLIQIETGKTGDEKKDYTDVGKIRTEHSRCSGEEGQSLGTMAIAAITGKSIITEKIRECRIWVTTALSNIGSRVVEEDGGLYLIPKGKTEKLEVTKVSDNVYLTVPLFLEGSEEGTYVKSYMYRYYYDKKGNRLDEYEMLDMKSAEQKWVKKSFSGIVVETTAIAKPIEKFEYNIKLTGKAEGTYGNSPAAKINNIEYQRAMGNIEEKDAEKINEVIRSKITLTESEANELMRKYPGIINLQKQQ